MVIYFLTSSEGKEWLDLWEFRIQIVLYLLQRNKGVYLDLSLVLVLYLILKLKLSYQNNNSISHLKDKAQLCISCKQEVQPSKSCACMTWQKQIHN